MRVWSVLLVTVCACGRIAFDPVGSDAGVGSDASLAPWPTLAGRWTWVGGSERGNESGTYGTLGVPAASDHPGARDNGAAWVGGDGALWVFAGSSSGTNIFDDLWRYDLAAGVWTWMAGSQLANQNGSYGTRGVADPANVPGARNDAMGWTSTSGDLILFGGFGYDGSGCHSALDDLWRYQIQAGEWTWLAGSATCDQAGSYGTPGQFDPTNAPGARSSAVVWAVPGGAWLFGGDGLDANATNGRMSDLWYYDEASDQWAWIGGANVVGQAPVNGVLGVASATNDPGSRAAGCTWSRPDELWLFGGGAIDGRRNDLWRYTISAATWTWIAGSSSPASPGAYGMRGVPDPATAPGARISSFCWQDGRGNFWLFGGQGNDRTGAVGSLSDLWVYQPELSEWTWVAGSDLVDQIGQYGTLGVPDAANTPGGRDIGGAWSTTDGRLWLFGGDFAYDSVGSTQVLDDLWRFAAP